METTAKSNDALLVDGTGSGGVEPRRAVAGPSQHPAKCEVSTIGPVVLDTVVTYPNPVVSTSKRECQMQDSCGGGAPNVSRAIQAHGGTAVPCFLVGDDCYGESMTDELGDEFSKARFVRGYETSRRSYIRPDGITDTTRPPLTLQRLPSHLRDVIAQTPVTVVAPMAAADHDLASDVLAAANYGIWQPSLSQLTDPISAQRLMPLARVTVMNDDEAREATGKDDPMEAIMVLSEAGCQGVIITSRDGALARIDGDWEFAPAHQVQAKRTSKAGDTFTGVFALAKALGRTTKEALELGQAAAARHVTEQTPLGDLEQLAAWAHTQPKVTLLRRAPKEAINVGRAVSVAVAAAAMILATVVFR